MTPEISLAATKSVAAAILCIEKMILRFVRGLAAHDGLTDGNVLDVVFIDGKDVLG